MIGGSGRIGRAIAADLLAHTDAALTLTGRRAQPGFKLQSRQRYLSLPLADEAAVEAAIAAHDLVIHCAGPFRDRNHHVLQTCIAQKIAYLDVADSPDHVRQALTYRGLAQTAGVTAVVSTGIFPGISGSLVRLGIEQFDQAESVHLSYLVAGSGGAGVTVMRTTFIELQTPFFSKINGEWQSISPYSQRQVLEFPRYGQGGVYWFNTVEALTLAETFPQVQTWVTKFGSVPDYYNHLTWLVAHRLPKAWLKSPTVIEFLSQVSYQMTRVTDRFSQTGIAMRVAIAGIQDGRPADYLCTFEHPDTARAAGHGTGSLAQLILSGQLQQPGVWPVEQALPTPLFQAMMAARSLSVQQRWKFSAPELKHSAQSENFPA